MQLQADPLEPCWQIALSQTELSDSCLLTFLTNFNRQSWLAAWFQTTWPGQLHALWHHHAYFAQQQLRPCRCQHIIDGMTQAGKSPTSRACLIPYPSGPVVSVCQCTPSCSSSRR